MFWADSVHSCSDFVMVLPMPGTAVVIWVAVSMSPTEIAARVGSPGW
jgi:hypothetical protein